MELAKTLLIEDNKHSMAVNLPEEMSLPEIWYAILGYGYHPIKAILEDGTIRITFGEIPCGIGIRESNQKNPEKTRDTELHPNGCAIPCGCT